jgi:hypothetical protein
VVLGILLAACATTPAQLPDSLFGAWEQSQGSVARLELSDGGRIELTLRDGTECVGDYGLSAMSDTEAILSTGYIQCPGLMDGYEMGADISMDGDILAIRGVFGGTYTRTS